MVQSGSLRAAWFLQAVYLRSQLEGSMAGEVGSLLQLFSIYTNLLTLWTVFCHSVFQVYQMERMADVALKEDLDVGSAWLAGERKYQTQLAVLFLNVGRFDYTNSPQFWLLPPDTAVSPRGVWRFKSLTIFFISCSLLRCDLEILPTMQGRLSSTMGWTTARAMCIYVLLQQ